MSTLQTPRRQGTRPPVDEPTIPLQVADDEFVADAFALLDHRARGRAIAPGLAPPGIYLSLDDGDRRHLIRVEDQITHLGRGGGCHVRFEDQRVSRDHAILVRHGRNARLLDNRSQNGTFVNGWRGLTTNVRDGDVIRLGPIAMQYVEVP